MCSYGLLIEFLSSHVHCCVSLGLSENFMLILSPLDVRLKTLHRQQVRTDQKRNGSRESAQAFYPANSMYRESLTYYSK